MAATKSWPGNHILRPERQYACLSTLAWFPRRTASQKGASGKLKRVSAGQAREGSEESFVEESPNAWWLSNRKRKSRREAHGVNSLLVKRSIRQYEELYHPGSLVVVGNIAAGATVRADGDIIVLGRLSGQAFAGCSGDEEATVVALVMEPTLIGISGRVFSGPEEGSSTCPEVASLLPSGTMRMDPLGVHVPYDNLDGISRSPLPDPIMARIAKENSVDVSWRTEALKGNKALWSAPAVAAAITGIYIMVAGLLVTAAPHTVFGLLFDVQTLSKGWIRVFGILAAVFGMYYLGATFGDIRGHGTVGFYASTVVGRLFIFISFCAIVMAGELPPSVLLLAVVNLFGAVSMLLSLQKLS